MSDSSLIVAKTIGNPFGGIADDPWPSGDPAEGDRVAIFAFDVEQVDGESEAIRTYHVTPMDRVHEGPVTAATTDPQGDQVQWTGCGAGTVVRRAKHHFGPHHFEVSPDNQDLF